MDSVVFSALTLASGTTLKNRLVKAAMEENMAVQGQVPGEAMIKLYSTWALGGAGLIITGNVMVDHLAMTGPGSAALEGHTDLEPYRRLAQAAKQNGTRVWMQINHPGRQVFKAMGGRCYRPLMLR